MNRYIYILGLITLAACKTTSSPIIITPSEKDSVIFTFITSEEGNVVDYVLQDSTTSSGGWVSRWSIPARSTPSTYTGTIESIPGYYRIQRNMKDTTDYTEIIRWQ